MCRSGHRAGCLIWIRRIPCCLQLKIIKENGKDLPHAALSELKANNVNSKKQHLASSILLFPRKRKLITQTTEQDMWPSFSSSPLDAGPEKEMVPKGYKAYLKPGFLPAPCWPPGGLVKAFHCCSQVWRLLRRLCSLSFLFLSEGRWVHQLSGRSELFLSEAICQHSFHNDYELICLICLHSLSPVSYKGESIKSCWISEKLNKTQLQKTMTPERPSTSAGLSWVKGKLKTSK